MAKLSHLDKFNTMASFTLTNDDMHCMSLLYQPIIGSDALSLYLTLTSLIERKNYESKEYNHSFLLDLTGYSIAKFMKNRQILEGVGLLSTYKNEDNYIYLLCPPFTAKQFLSDGVLGLYLYSKVGENIYNDLRNRFKVRKIDKTNYLNISASFDDVFETIHGDRIKQDNAYIMDKKASRPAKFTNYEFDFHEFLNDINQSLLASGVTEAFKEKIIQTAGVYGFDEGDMAALFNESIASTGYFDQKILKKKAKVLYTYKHQDNLPTIQVKKNINNDNEIIRAIENSTGQEFLESILGDQFKKSDVNKLNELFNTLKLNPSVIKIMVMYVAKIIKAKGDGSALFPPVSYFKQVEDNWILNGITDVYDAYNRYILNITSNDSKPKKLKKGIEKPLTYTEENKANNIMNKMETL